MILDKKGLKRYQIGKTKVFLRVGQMAELDARRAEVLGNAARTIQQQIRTYITRKEFISLRKAAIQLQSHCQGGSPLGSSNTFHTRVKQLLYWDQPSLLLYFVLVIESVKAFFPQ